MGGSWIIRVEDLDPPREVEGSAERILATLAAFGMTSDRPVMWQSTRGDRYLAALARLVDAGNAFACSCSRKQLESTGGRHRSPCIAPVDPRQHAWRLQVSEGEVGFDDLLYGRYVQNLSEDVGDVVLKRSDGPWAYQLAVVVDDAEQGISEVVRGADLLDSTPRQILLQRRLGLPTPGYLHLPLVLDADGRKLGKSLASLPVDAADPLPALHAALHFLGQDAQRDGGSVSTILRRAERAFTLASIPQPVPSRMVEASD